MNQQILEAKQNTVKEIVERFNASQTVIFAEYRGLTVARIQEIRRALAKENAEMCVYKNSLVERAMDELGQTEAKDLLAGPNAVIFSQDVTAGAKVVAKYAKRYKDILVIKGGVVEGKFADADKIKEVAKLPGKDGLISMFLSCLQAPVRSFACAVQAVADAK